MTSPRHTRSSIEHNGADRRRVRQLVSTTWTVALLLSIGFAVATGGIGLFAVGIVLATGLVMAGMPVRPD